MLRVNLCSDPLNLLDNSSAGMWMDGCLYTRFLISSPLRFALILTKGENFL